MLIIESKQSAKKQHKFKTPKGKVERQEDSFILLDDHQTSHNQTVLEVSTNRKNRETSAPIENTTENAANECIVVMMKNKTEISVMNSESMANT